MPNDRPQFAHRALRRLPPPERLAAPLRLLPEPLLRPEFRDVVVKLETGAVSDPLPAADGWHILKLTGRRPARDLTLDEARPDIVAALRGQEQRRLRAEYIAKITAANPVRVDEVALGKLKIPAD